MQYIEITKWDEFQHYKHRNPPWIKLYSHLLDNDEFDCLPDASKLLYLCLLLFASRRDNRIKLDFKWLQRKLPIENQITKDTMQPLIDNGFILCKHHASKPQADRKQNAIPEKSKEEKRRDRVNSQNTPDLEEKKPLTIDGYVPFYNWFSASLQVDESNDIEKRAFMKYARLCVGTDANFNRTLTDMIADIECKVKEGHVSALAGKKMFTGWIKKRFPGEFKQRKA
jgi:hypothetical protein